MPKDKKIEAVATELALPLIEAMGLALWGLEFRGGAGGKNVLRLFVDVGPDAKSAPDAASYEEDGVSEAGVSEAGVSEAGVSIDKCARISRDLGLALEVEDIIPGAYTLEVSSPGFERRFFTADQMREYIGRDVRVDLYEGLSHPFPGRKRLSGKLVSMDGEEIRLEVDGEDVVTNFSAAKRARLVHHFETPAPKGGGKKKKGKK